MNLTAAVSGKPQLSGKFRGECDMDLEMLQMRARIIRGIRTFFDDQGYLEVDTPLLSPDLIPESCLEVFETTRLSPPHSRVKSEKLYLIPSPEIWMKKLISAHKASLYQVCKSFRNGESSGETHSPEFTMLEYYTMNAGYRDSLAITQRLLARIFGNESVPAPEITEISMEEAFERWAGFPLYERAAERGGLAREAERLGLDPMPGLSTPELYDLIFVSAVEPNLPKDKAVALMDYPAFVPTLAKKSADGKTRERWELYLNGVELANCYSEETDPEEVRRFFESEAAAKEKSALVKHKVDSEYWRIFANFPRCSGAAMGVDRLVMAVAGRSTIDGVLPFPMRNLSGS
jgi:lysyl-tRNA synthetase class 2